MERGLGQRGKEKMFFTSNVLRILGVTLGVVLSGCAGNSSGSRITLAPSDALRSESQGKGDLITISAMYVPRIEARAQLPMNQVERELFYAQVVDAFVAESGIEIKREGAVLGKLESGSDLGRARAAGSDSILRIEVTDYRSKEGSALGTSRSALFAAQFSIVRIADQKIIWRSDYYSEDHPNSYNLIEVGQRLGRDRGTSTPDQHQLMKEAASKAAVDFSRRRIAQFTAGEKR
jgi:hypothetical protein